MDVSQILKQAWAAVQDADLPEEIQQVAFQEATRLIAASELQSLQPAAVAARSDSGTQSSGAGTSSKLSSGPSSGVGVTEKSLLESVSSHTDIDFDKLMELVHLDDEELRVSLPAVKLGRNNADKTRAIAQILAVVRYCGLDEPETPYELIRAEVMRLKCYDSANFSAQLSGLSNVGYITSGSGRNRKLRPKPASLKAFAVLVSKLAGE